MQLPEGSLILIIAWGFVVFLLWNLFHFSQAFRKTTFSILAGLASAGLAGGIAFLHFHQQPRRPDHRTGVLIFPLIEETDSALAGAPRRKNINATGLAFAEMIGDHLQHATNTPFYVIPTETLFDAAKHDSLSDLDYVLRFAQHANLQMTGFGVYRMTMSAPANHQDSWSVEFQIFDLRKKSPEKIRLPLPERSDNLQDWAAEIARGIFQVASSVNKITWAPAGQNQFAIDLWQRYYAVKFALAMNQTEPALQQARALWQNDSSRAKFATLYTRAFLRHLRSQKTNQDDGLRLILPLAKRAAATDSLGGESARLLGEIYIRQKKWNEAEQALLQARRREPTDSKIYPLLAHLHVSRLQPRGFQNELELYQHARTLNPLNIEAGLAEADYYWRENRAARAIAIFEDLLRLNPDHVEVLMSWGRIYIAKGNKTKIFEIYERILKVAPDNAEAYYNLGIVHYHHEDIDNAVKFFERAIKLNDHAEARLYLASIHERRGDIERAIQCLRERVRMSRGDDDIYAAEARRQLYKILLARGEIPAHLQPDSLEKP